MVTGSSFILLIVHLLLGYRRLGDMRYYQDDPMVCRLLGLKRLPDVATVRRTLASLDDGSVTNLRRLSRQRVLEQLGGLGLARITLDFDGSVLSTGRFAEGTAVGYNNKKKGQRSYYPRCSVPWPRRARCSMSGIVRATCMIPMVPGPSSWPVYGKYRLFCLHCVIEARMDSAFFSDDIIGMLDDEGVEFTVSVPV